MFSKVIALVFVALLLHGSVGAQTPSQSPAQTAANMQQVLYKAKATNKAVKVILARKIDNQRKLSGKVSEVSDTGFAVTDQKTGKTTNLAYQDVREVKQQGMSTGSKIAIGVGIGAAVCLVPVLVFKPWRSE